jgi:phage tail-like protein
MTQNTPLAVLQQLQFQAESNPSGGAIDLIWDIQIEADAWAFPDPDSLRLVIRRQGQQEGSFPGLNRRGECPVAVNPGNLDSQGGTEIYNSLDSTKIPQIDFEKTWEERSDRHQIVTIYQYAGLSGEHTLVRTLRQASQSLMAGQRWQPTRLTVRFTDRQDLTPGTIYYYTAFVFGQSAEGAPQLYFSRQSQASALCTRRYGHALFNDLPQVHQQFDTTLPPRGMVAQEDAEKGQLQRFLEVFDAHADMLRGHIESLQDLHDIERVDSRLLPHLAHYIGWKLSANLNEVAQRDELRSALELYRRVGTQPNLVTMIRRLTGWEVFQIHEFGRHVLTTYDPNRWETVIDQAGNSHRYYLDETFGPTQDYLDYLDINKDIPEEEWPEWPEDEDEEAECWQGRQDGPPGSLNTDSATHKRALWSYSPSDPNVYTYDPDGKYNPATLGIYIPFDLPADQEKVLRKALADFLPVQVNLVFFSRRFNVSLPKTFIPIICQTEFTLACEITPPEMANQVMCRWEQIAGPALTFMDSPTSPVVRVQRPQTLSGPFRFQVTVTDGVNPFVGQVTVSNIPTEFPGIGAALGTSCLFPELTIQPFLRPNQRTRVYQLNELEQAYFGWLPLVPGASGTKVLRYEVLKLNRTTHEFEVVRVVLPGEALKHQGTVGDYYRVRAYLGAHGRSFFIDSETLSLFERETPQVKTLYVDELGQAGASFGFIAEQVSHKAVDETEVQRASASAAMGAAFGGSTITYRKVVEQETAAPTQAARALMGCGFGFSTIDHHKDIEGEANP